MKIRPSHTHGDEGEKGTSTLHRTFCFGPIFNGGRDSAATPAPFAPRNCGQLDGGLSAAATKAVVAKNKITGANDVVMKSTPCFPRARVCDAIEVSVSANKDRAIAHRI